MGNSCKKQEIERRSSICSLFFLLFIFCGNILPAQQNLPLNREWSLEYEKAGACIPAAGNPGPDDSLVRSVISDPFSSCFKPYIVSIAWQQKDRSKSWIVRKLKKESLFIVNDTADKFHLQVDPLFNFQFGEDLAGKTQEKLYVNTRGFLMRGSIGKKIAFESSFYENQATFPQYMDDYIASTNNLFSPQEASYIYNVVPGQGRSKPFHTNGYDYAMASGYVSYSPAKIVNIQVGNGKHFVGDGYRSLLLSDNAFNYPYARITTTCKWFEYTNLYTSFMNLTSGGAQTPPHTERLFQKKTGSFQFLSVNLWKRLQIGLFQGMIWQAADTTNKQHLSFNTFDPVIGVNTAIYGLHNTNNIVWGATLKLRITRSFSIYGQYMLDDLASGSNGGDVNNKSGYQLGFKYFDLFTVKNLHLQVEYNTVRPYAYAAADQYQSYTQYNQALGDPLGANFQELVGFLNYRIRDFFIGIQGNYMIKGTDSAAYNYGGDVFRPSDVFPAGQQLQDIRTTQGVKNTIMYEDVHIGYLLNPSTNWNIVIGVTNRSDQTYKGTANSQVFYIGMRTSLVNLYNDF